MTRSCPDCGKDVSGLAKVCPNCGRPNPAKKRKSFFDYFPPIIIPLLIFGIVFPPVLFGAVLVIIGGIIQLMEDR
jgi:hypothetical protein